METSSAGLSEAQTRAGATSHCANSQILPVSVATCSLLKKGCWEEFKVETFNLLIHRGNTSIADGQMLVSQKRKRSKLMESFTVGLAPFHKTPISLAKQLLHISTHTHTEVNSVTHISAAASASTDVDVSAPGWSPCCCHGATGSANKWLRWALGAQKDHLHT